MPSWAIRPCGYLQWANPSRQAISSPELCQDLQTLVLHYYELPKYGPTAYMELRPGQPHHAVVSDLLQLCSAQRKNVIHSPGGILITSNQRFIRSHMIKGKHMGRPHRLIKTQTTIFHVERAIANPGLRKTHTADRCQWVGPWQAGY